MLGTKRSNHSRLRWALVSPIFTLHISGSMFVDGKRAGGARGAAARRDAKFGCNCTEDPKLRRTD